MPPESMTVPASRDRARPACRTCRPGGRAGSTRGRMLLAACVWMAAATARAEDDRLEDAPRTGAAVRPEQNLVDLGQNFDSNLFDQAAGGWTVRPGWQVQLRGNLPGGGARAVRRASDEPESPLAVRARQQAERRLDRIDRVCGLSEAQRRTLQLAMEAEARGLVELVEAERRRYADVRISLADEAGQRQWHRFQEEVQRLRGRMAGLFGAGSLTAKVLAVTLDDAQRGRLDGETRARRTFRWRSLVAGAMLSLDDTLGLSQRQHDAVEKLLMAAEPPLVVRDGPGQPNAHAERMLVYKVLAGVDQQALRAAVSERQWKLLATLAQQGRAMESWLSEQGLVERPAP